VEDKCCTHIISEMNQMIYMYSQFLALEELWKIVVLDLKKQKDLDTRVNLRHAFLYKIRNNKGRMSPQQW